MFEKNRKFYADWRNGKGVRLRKAFTSERAALKYETEQKQQSQKERKEKGQRTPARIVLTTVANPEEARRLGAILVEERLAACSTLVPVAESIYRWQGKVESATETLLLIKTGSEQLAVLQARLLALHGYQTPEFLVLRVEAGSQAYLDWLQASLCRI
jgi:periplasmic divalent cation tolerance protein